MSLLRAGTARTAGMICAIALALTAACDLADAEVAGRT